MFSNRIFQVFLGGILNTCIGQIWRILPSRSKSVGDENVQRCDKKIGEEPYFWWETLFLGSCSPNVENQFQGWLASTSLLCISYPLQWLHIIDLTKWISVSFALRRATYFYIYVKFCIFTNIAVLFQTAIYRKLALNQRKGSRRAALIIHTVCTETKPDGLDASGI